MKRLVGTRAGLAALTRLTAMLAIGFTLLGTVGTAFAGTVSRDHRGPNGAPSGGVTVNGQKAKVSQAPKLGGDRPNDGRRPNGNFESLTGEKGRAPWCAIIAAETAGWAAHDARNRQADAGFNGKGSAGGAPVHRPRAHHPWLKRGSRHGIWKILPTPPQAAETQAAINRTASAF